MISKPRLVRLVHIRKPRQDLHLSGQFILRIWCQGQNGSEEVARHILIL